MPLSMAFFIWVSVTALQTHTYINEISPDNDNKFLQMITILITKIKDNISTRDLTIPYKVGSGLLLVELL